METLLRINHVNKSYGKQQVLHDINLEFKEGIHGLLGPNGAGKTTLMRAILGLIPYEGTIRIENTRIGYLPQDFQMFGRLTVQEAMEYVATLKDVSKQTIDEALEYTALEQQRSKKIKALSGGMLRRLGIAQAILGGSKILVLDEPTVGLDPKQRANVRDLVASLKDSHMVLLSTHIVEDIEYTADTITVINQGVIEAHGKQRELIQDIHGRVQSLIAPRGAESGFPDDAIVLQKKPVEGGISYRLLCHQRIPGAIIEQENLEDFYFSIVGEQNE